MQWGDDHVLQLAEPRVAKDLKPGDSVRFRFRQADGDSSQSIEKTEAPRSRS
jgi:hypothetical protein